MAQASLPFTLLLGVLVALTALGMDMFLPAVPVIARALAAEAGPGAAQLTITTYLAGLALGQLAWGPVSDRFGRKPVLLCGLALSLCAALWGANAASIAELTLVRFLQGVGMSSGPVIARSIVRDLYQREQAARLLARMMAVFGVIPVAAPLAGGLVVELGGWPPVFALFAVLAAALLAASGLALGGAPHWSAVVLPMLVFIFGCAFIIPSGIATALAPFPQIAGAASSLLGAIPFGLGALVSATLAAAFDGTTRPMACAIGLFAVGAFAAERLQFRRVAHG